MLSNLYSEDLCAKRASKMIVPPKIMLLSFSIGTFLPNYDVTNRKLYYTLTYSIVWKRTKWEWNIPMETTKAYTYYCYPCPLANICWLHLVEKKVKKSKSRIMVRKKDVKWKTKHNKNKMGHDHSKWKECGGDCCKHVTFKT